MCNSIYNNKLARLALNKMKNEYLYAVEKKSRSWLICSVEWEPSVSRLFILTKLIDNPSFPSSSFRYATKVLMDLLHIYDLINYLWYSSYIKLYN